MPRALAADTRRFDRLVTRRASRLILRGFALLVAAFSVWLLSALVQEKEYGWALIPTALLAVVSIFEFVLADVIIDNRFPRNTQQFLERLQEKLTSTPMEDEILSALRTCIASFSGCAQGQISATVHLSVTVYQDSRGENASALIQLSDYTRSGLGGRRWRTLDPAKGLVGRCVRMDQKVWVNFRSEVEYLSRMVEEFGYSTAEARMHTTTGRSYLAYPLHYGGGLIGVIYFFSTEPQVFPLAASDDRLQEAALSIVGLLRVAEII